MKRCPECRRDYLDETLRFCLDDGAALLDGPGSLEPATAHIPSFVSGAENTITSADTKIHTTEGLTATVPKQNRYKLVAGLLLGAVIIAGFGYGAYKFLLGKEAAPPRPVTAINSQRLTGDGKVRESVISPDGKLVAYIRTEGGDRSIWVKQIPTNTTLQVVKPGELDGFGWLTFSPDGVFLYFNAEPKTDDPRSVYRVSTLGGTPTKVLNNAVSVEFSPDAKRLSFWRFDFATNETALWVANIDGSNERKFASRTGAKFYQEAHSWSPDGKHIAGIAGDDGLEPGPILSIVLITVDGGEVVDIGKQKWGAIDELVWHPSGDSLLIAGGETTMQNQIWELSYPGGEPRRLTNNLNGHYSVSITADGKSIVTGEIYSRSALWVSPDLKPENAKQIMPATADTWGFSWTPDNRLVFSTDQTGEAEIWIIDADGANAKPLTNDHTFKQVPVVSADGRYIVYASVAETNRLERIDINGGNRSILAPAIGADNPDISLDSKWVLFSAYIGGESKIMRIPIEGGEPQILTQYKATEPRYSHDGKYFACFTPNETTGFWTKLAIVPAEGGQPIKILDAPPRTNLGRGPVWTPDGKGITVVIAEGEKQNLWLLPVDGSPGKRMTNFEVPGTARREYSRDGKRLAMMRAEGIGNAIMITDFR